MASDHVFLLLNVCVPVHICFTVMISLSESCKDCKRREEQGEVIRKKFDRTPAASVYNNDEMYLFSTLGPGTPQHGPVRK